MRNEKLSPGEAANMAMGRSHTERLLGNIDCEGPVFTRMEQDLRSLKKDPYRAAADVDRISQSRTLR